MPTPKNKPKQVKAAPRKQKNGNINYEKKEGAENTIYKKWVFKAVDMMKEHYSNPYIREYISQKKEGSTSPTVLDNIMQDARTLVITGQFNKAQEIIPLHIARYNRNVKRCLAVKEIDEDEVDGEVITWAMFWAARNKKIAAYSDAINALVQKETLLQFHNGDFTIEINTEETVEIKETRPKFDISKLTFQEQVELYELIKKSRIDENELIAITQAQGEAEVKTEDITHTVVERANIEDVKQVQLPAPPYKSPITREDPTIRLRETLAKLAAKRFQEAGGTLSEDEKELIK